MNKLISIIAGALLATSFFVAPVSAMENNQLVNEQAVYANCAKMAGSAKDACLRGLSGSDR